MNLVIKKKNIMLYGQLIIYILVSGVLLYLSNSVVGDLLAFIFLIIGGMSIVKFDLAHPYVWYSFVFMLYSISYPILYLNNMTYDIYIYTDELMFSQWLAMVTFFLVIGPNRISFSKLNKTKFKMIPSKKFFLILSAFLILTIFETSTGGYTHKNEIYSNGSFLVSMGFRIALIFLVLYALNLSIYSIRNNKLDYKLGIFAGIIMFLMFFFSGERDLLIRFFVLSLFIYYIIIKKSKLNKEIIILGLGSLSLIPILSRFKYFGLTGETTEKNMNFILEFLNSDFQSASKNLQILLLDDSVKGTFGGTTFLSAIIRSINLDKLPWIDTISSMQWYNERYFAINRAGQGFTVVGDGYINFGYLGIILFFIFIGILIKVIYTKSNKNIYFFIYYIMSIPVFMYSIRADLANLLSPLVKQNLIVIVAVKFLIDIVNQSKETKGYRSIDVDKINDFEP